MRNIIFITALIISLAGCHEKPAATATSEEVIPVKLMPVSGDSSANEIRVSGSMSTEEIANLSFKVGGIIDQIFVKEGDRVRKGQLLANLKPTEISAQVQQAQLARDKADRDYRRAKNLYTDSVVTLEQLQNAKTALDIAAQSVEQASFNQQYSKIYAPADGFINAKKLNAGELASFGTTVLAMNLASGKSDWTFKAAVSDIDWSLISKGDKATVKLDAFPSKEFAATVSRKALAAEAVTGSFTLELDVNVDSEKPAVGMFGSASIKTSHPSRGFKIPYDAVLEANGKNGFVFVSDDKKHVKKVEVSIAHIDDEAVSISKGLEGHPYVVISGSPYLNEASLITPR